ncbi:hypothetical protein E3P99_01845 [Wallemia hederae]|uniref:F-box domain-containing protein n=1 Tax=Wallemia hederae TaxID=1540922 RepID=A0A4T0FPX8_9BASI|nr:hypothetical protein E3P99_01845 [Wallemia hederae]
MSGATFNSLPIELVEMVYKHTNTRSYTALIQASRNLHAIGTAPHLLNVVLSRKVYEEYGGGDIVDADATHATPFPWPLFADGLSACALCARCALRRAMRVMKGFATGSEEILTQAHSQTHSQLQFHILGDYRNDAIASTPDITLSGLQTRRGSADSAISSASESSTLSSSTTASSAFSDVSAFSTLSTPEQDHTDKLNCIIHSVSPAAASMLAWLM